MTENVQDTKRFATLMPDILSVVASERLFESPVVQAHLVDPSTPAKELGEITGVSLDTVVQTYLSMQRSPAIKAVVFSPNYPRRLMTMEGRTLVKDWIADPNYAEKVLKDESVSPRNLEIHATEGVCDQGCAMCLWSNKRDKTYTILDLKGDGLMSNAQWIQAIGEAKETGTKRIIFSGGGEPLLRRGLFEIVGAANDIGLATQLYSNGFRMDKLTDEEKAEMTRMERVRFSIHSPDPDTYNTIVNMSPRLNALERVKANVAELLKKRENEKGRVQVGIGFVTQPTNYTQIEQMAEWAADLGVDFLNLRQDEVSVTEGLTSQQREQVANQLRAVRERTINGGYGNIAIDMSDELTALANGIALPERSVSTCHMKQVRPAISPYGEVGACDLMVEPNFANNVNTFGDVRRSLPMVFDNASNKHVRADCAECMPSGRTGNAIMTKLKEDYRSGIDFTQQPFNF